MQLFITVHISMYSPLLASAAGHIFVAKERYDAIGARSNRVLSFEKGEELEVFNPLSTAEWWEVSLSLPTGFKN